MGLICVCGFASMNLYSHWCKVEARELGHKAASARIFEVEQLRAQTSWGTSENKSGLALSQHELDKLQRVQEEPDLKSENGSRMAGKDTRE